MKSLLVVSALVAATSVASAQWLRIPTAGIPRTPDGKPNLSAPAPRMADGKISVAGLWRPAARLIGDIRRAMTPGETVPQQPR